MRRHGAVALSALAVLAAAGLAGCTTESEPTVPGVPESLSVWRDDRPYGQAAVNLQQRVVRNSLAGLTKTYPRVRHVDGNAIDVADEARLIAAVDRDLRRDGWNAPVTMIIDRRPLTVWKRGESMVAVQMIAPYAGDTLRLVEFYGSGVKRSAE